MIDPFHLFFMYILLRNYRIRRCLVPLNGRHFAKLGGGLDKGDFYLTRIYI